MSKNLYTDFRELIIEIIEDLIQQKKINPVSGLSKITVDPPKDLSHGELSCNAAMILAKEANLPPKQLAEIISGPLAQHPLVKDVQIAGPGFINISLEKNFWYEQLTAIIHEGVNYGNSPLGDGQNINIEYVSVNPTGPLHMGHSRVAIVADVLCNLLEKAGYKIIREYYVNDSGGQARMLVLSVYQRYLEAQGHSIGEIDGYKGDYLIAVGQEIANNFGDRWVNQPEEIWYETLRKFTIDLMMDRIKSDLHDLNIHHDVITYESDIVNSGKVKDAFEKLQALGLIYKGILEPPKGKAPEDWEPREQDLFRATQFGDDIDRPLKKSDGSWTYFACDIAYHYDKFKRGAAILIDILGADHGGYVKRIGAAVEAITEKKGRAIVKLCQMVRFIDQGQVLKMSKRAGIFVTVQDAIEKVGRDAIRFIMLTRKNDAQLDFDFTKVVEQTKDNPVFYVQYAHARCSSIKRHLLNTFPKIDIRPESLAQLPHDQYMNDQDEINLIKLMATWPRIIESAAQTYEPHRIAFYLYDVASAFHALWNKGKDHDELRFVNPHDETKSQGRFALIHAVMVIIASGLQILGVTPVEEMR